MRKARRDIARDRGGNRCGIFRSGKVIASRDHFFHSRGKSGDNLKHHAGGLSEKRKINGGARDTTASDNDEKSRKWRRMFSLTTSDARSYSPPRGNSRVDSAISRFHGDADRSLNRLCARSFARFVRVSFCAVSLESRFPSCLHNI